MNLHEQLALFLGFILLGAGQVIAVVAGIVIGGFKWGDLKKTIEFKLNRDALNAAWAQMHGRLMELGFAVADDKGRYLQSGETFGDPGSFTHARTRKELTVNFQDTGADINASLTLRYLSFIVYDSGESAYRDAVLNYVSGQADRMMVVPNRSLLATNCLTGGAISLLAGVLIFMFRLHDFRPAVLVSAPTAMMVGLLGLVIIWQKPKEISGKSMAITGIALSAASLAMAYAR